MKKYARPIAICIFYHQDKILAVQGYDKIRKQKFYRPIGGGIELGETSRQALKREIKEELNADIINLKQIGIIENIFTYQGKPGHEIVFIYDAEFKDKKFYRQKNITVNEKSHKSLAFWLPIDKLPLKNQPIYPPELLGLVKNNIPSCRGEVA